MLFRSIRRYMNITNWGMPYPQRNIRKVYVRVSRNTLRRPFEYNEDGERVKSALPEGNTVENAYATENLGSVDYRKSRFKHGNLLENKQLPDSDRGGAQQQIEPTYTYDPIYNRVRTQTDPRGNDSSHTPPNGGTNSKERYTPRISMITRRVII